MTGKEEVRVGRRKVALSNLDKLYWPDDGITKGDLVAYYRAVADVMVPHVEQRLLTMERYPEGIGGQRFYQKDASKYFPAWIPRKRAPKERGTGSVDHVVCNEPAALVYLANQGCITFHAGLHRIDRMNRPDQFVMDLDPSTADFSVVQRAALATRELLEEIGLTPFVKTSGSKGLHVVAALRRTSTFDDVRDFARAVAATLERRFPDELTTEHRKANRADKLYLDAGRNAFGAHAVAPYSVRARPGATVAMPIRWSEVEDPKLRSSRYTIANALGVVADRGDLWRDLRGSASSLPAARKRLDRMS